MNKTTKIFNFYQLGNLFISKKAQVTFTDTGIIRTKIFTVTGIIITIIIILSAMAVLTPEAQVAGDALEATGAPLGSLFSSQGIVITLFIVGVFLLIIQSSVGLRLGRGTRR